MKLSFSLVSRFEKEIASFFGAPYAIATDSCTHAIELCLRLNKRTKSISIPKHTYISIPFTALKIGMDFEWKNEYWEDFYQIGDTNIYDAAVLWKQDSYIPESFMCISFQFQKHLSLGRGGMILTDNIKSVEELKKMTYDGRLRDIPWRDQDIKTIGYHYYMLPEIAKTGIEKLPKAKKELPKKWNYRDYPDLSQMSVFTC